jgi:hypothetical protein
MIDYEKNEINGNPWRNLHPHFLRYFPMIHRVSTLHKLMLHY